MHFCSTVFLLNSEIGKNISNSTNRYKRLNVTSSKRLVMKHCLPQKLSSWLIKTYYYNLREKTVGRKKSKRLITMQMMSF